jgi:hypothetical protein
MVRGFTVAVRAAATSTRPKRRLMRNLKREVSRSIDSVCPLVLEEHLAGAMSGDSSGGAA